MIATLYSLAGDVANDGDADVFDNSVVVFLAIALLIVALIYFIKRM